MALEWCAPQYTDCSRGGAVGVTEYVVLDGWGGFP